MKQIAAPAVAAAFPDVEGESRRCERCLGLSGAGYDREILSASHQTDKRFSFVSSEFIVRLLGSQGEKKLIDAV